MAFNINEFRANIRDFGYIDNNSFEVFVQTPPVLSNVFLGNQGTPTKTYKIAKNMSFRIDQVRAPGISLVTADVFRYGLGTTQKQPYNAQFNEVNISMIGDHYCEFWQFWYQWTRAIFQYNGTSGGAGLAPNYTTEYKDQYASTIMIWIYDHFGNIIQKINLFEAFPTAIREFPLSWGDNNLLRINVGINYTEYTIENSTLQPRSQVQPTRLTTGGVRESVTI